MTDEADETSKKRLSIDDFGGDEAQFNHHEMLAALMKEAHLENERAELDKIARLESMRLYVRALPGGYRERFDALVEHAFSQHKMLLNAAQMRELVGGGSQSTAQASLDAFRDGLHKRTTFRLDLSSASVPTELGQKASRVIVDIWTAACSEAKKAFEEERSEQARLVEEARSQIQAARDENASILEREKSVLAEVAQLQAEVAAGGIRLRTAKEESAALAEEKASLSIALDKSRAETAAEKELVEAVRRGAAAQEAASAEAADNLRRDHREQLATAARERQQEVQRLVAERDAAARERDAAKDRAVELELAKARSDQQASQLREQAKADAERIAVIDTIQSELAGLKALVDGLKAKDAEQTALLAASRAAFAQSQSQFERLLERVERRGEETDPKKQAKPGTQEGKA